MCPTSRSGASGAGRGRQGRVCDAGGGRDASHKRYHCHHHHHHHRRCNHLFSLPTAAPRCPVLRCCSAGIAIRGRAYDIILAKDATDFVLKSWFDTRPGAEGLAPPHRLCMCLNPVRVGGKEVLALLLVLSVFNVFKVSLIPSSSPTHPPSLSVQSVAALWNEQQFG